MGIEFSQNVRGLTEHIGHEPLEVLCFSYACSYAGRVFPLMAGVPGDAEAQK